MADTENEVYPVKTDEEIATLISQYATLHDKIYAIRDTIDDLNRSYYCHGDVCTMPPEKERAYGCLPSSTKSPKERVNCCVVKSNKNWFGLSRKITPTRGFCARYKEDQTKLNAARIELECAKQDIERVRSEIKSEIAMIKVQFEKEYLYVRAETKKELKARNIPNIEYMILDHHTIMMLDEIHRNPAGRYTSSMFVPFYNISSRALLCI